MVMIAPSREAAGFNLQDWSMTRRISPPFSGVRGTPGFDNLARKVWS
jgi:hypothetical protein